MRDVNLTQLHPHQHHYHGEQSYTHLPQLWSLRGANNPESRGTVLTETQVRWAFPIPCASQLPQDSPLLKFPGFSIPLQRPPLQSGFFVCLFKCLDISRGNCQLNSPATARGLISFRHKDQQSLGWSSDSVCKNICCSSTGPEYSSQHPRQKAHNCL